MRVALVHDYLFEQGGAENVFLELAKMFPDAPIYTSIYAPETMDPLFRRRDVRTTYLQHLTTDKERAKALLPLYPMAFGRLRLRGFDLVLSSASSFAKNVDVGATPHVCYCHTPPRFLWQTERYIEQSRSRLKRAAALSAAAWLRPQDRRAGRSISQFIANSRLTQRRIRRVYGRPSVVIHPPVAVDEFVVAPHPDRYFLVLSRLLPYKRVDIVVEACNRLSLPLVIVGDGPDRERIAALAGPSVTVLGRLPREEVRRHLAHCLALVLPGAEDFGLTPLEANASGRPVVAFRAGGALETIVEGETGWFFDAQTPECLAPLLERIADGREPLPDSHRLRVHARGFDVPAFQRAVIGVLDRALLLRNGSGEGPDASLPTR